MRKRLQNLNLSPSLRWLLTVAATLLSGLALAALLRLIDSQSIRQTLAALAQPSFWYTALFLWLWCGFFTLLCHSLFAGCLRTFLPTYVLVLINYFKQLITSVPLTLGDISLIGQLGKITALNTEAIRFSRNTILALVLAVLWLVLCFLADRPLRIRWRWSLLGAAGAAACLFLLFWLGAGALVYRPLHVEPGRPISQAVANDRCGGPVLGMWQALYHSAHRDLGENYSKAHMEQRVEQARALAPARSGPADREHPNVILILSESFFDISKLPGVSYPEDPVAEFHALQQEGVSGRFYTRSLGYGTCNIELEILTGLNSGLLAGEDLYSWDPAVFSRLSTVVSLLKDQGYSTDMLHMFNDEIYHRKGFFSRLGFDNLYFSDALAEFYPPAAQAEDYWDYMNSRIDGQYYSDDLMADALIALYEKRTAAQDGPVFLYGISMENHSLYIDKYAPEELTVAPVSALEGEAAENLLYLSQGVSNASAALEKLVDYFRTQDQPTVIVFYGDHRPGLGLNSGGSVYSALGMVDEEHSQWSAEQLAELYSTDYLIWANDHSLLPGEPGSTMDTSCNYLGATLLDLAGVEKPLYWRLLSQLSETRLCDTWEYHLGRDGALSKVRPDSGAAAEEMDLLTEFLNDVVYGRQYAGDALNSFD